MSWIKKIISKLAEWLQSEYKHVYEIDLPESIKEKTIYIIGEKNSPWLIAFTCPCGCKENIQLNLLKEADPNWRFKITYKNKINISPSVWRTTGCKSHFFVRNSKIDWVGRKRWKN